MTLVKLPRDPLRRRALHSVAYTRYHEIVMGLVGAVLGVYIGHRGLTMSCACLDGERSPSSGPLSDAVSGIVLMMMVIRDAGVVGSLRRLGLLKRTAERIVAVLGVDLTSFVFAVLLTFAYTGAWAGILCDFEEMILCSSANMHHTGCHATPLFLQGSMCSTEVPLD